MDNYDEESINSYCIRKYIINKNAIQKTRTININKVIKKYNKKNKIFV